MDTKPAAIEILLTNDDGIHAEGLRVLRRMLLSCGYKVHVVAPERERSAVGHAITLHKPLRISRVCDDSGFEGWSVTGTPADCVKLAVFELLERPPDIVISGINPGANVGINLNYSGTVAAAREAALGGLKAMAVSLQLSGTPAAISHFDPAARVVAELVPVVHRSCIDKGVFFNINIPASPEHASIRVTPGRQGLTYSKDIFEKRFDLRGRGYYWQSVAPLPDSADVDSDCALLRAGTITITPVRCDMTDYVLLDHMKSWGLEEIGEKAAASRSRDGQE